MWQYNYSDEYLCHWGIKGMKWGVRRYQNKDGSLTSAGKIRYNVKSVSKKPSSKVINAESNNVRPARKTIESMTDDELTAAINRIQKEKQLKALLDDSRESQNIKTGNNYISKALKEGSSQALSAITKTTLLYLGGKVLAKMFGNPELGKAISSAVNDSGNKSNDSATSKTKNKDSNSNNSKKAKKFPEGFIDASFKSVNSNKSNNNGPIIDVEFTEVVDDAATSYGNNIISQYLALPEWRDD